MLATSIVESKQNHARHTTLASSDDLAEVEIEGIDNTFLGDGFSKDVSIRQTLQPFIPKVHDVMSRCSQPPGNANRDAHVC